MDKFVRPNIWIKNYKKMIDVERVNYDVKTVESDLVQGDLYEFYFDEIVFLRPTYLRDSNDVYVYENDILKWTSGTKDKVSGQYSTEKYIVVFNFGRFIAVCKDNPRYIEELSDFMNTQGKETVEVEKNIHEAGIKLPDRFLDEDTYIEANQ